MEFYNQKKLEISKKIYERFLSEIQEKLNKEPFKKSLDNVLEIDKKYYAENITIQEMEKILKEYSHKEILNVDNVNKIQLILSGNPEIVFRMGIEAVRQNVRMEINIDDFCLAQNTLLIEFFNLISKEMGLGEILILKNLVKDEEIIKPSKNFDMTVCFGNSNDYYRLKREDKIINLKLYPFYIFELHSDSLELEEVRRGLFDYISRNQFDIEIYDMDLDIEEVITEMNRDGYGFCSILLSKDKEKIKKFKENIKSKYIFVNENPFKKIEFIFDLRNV